MFTFKVIYTSGATEVFSGASYRTTPSQMVGQPYCQIEVDSGRFITVQLRPPIPDGCGQTRSPDEPDEIETVYIVNENGKAIDTIKSRQ